MTNRAHVGLAGEQLGQPSRHELARPVSQQRLDRGRHEVDRRVGAHDRHQVGIAGPLPALT